MVNSSFGGLFQFAGALEQHQSAGAHRRSRLRDLYDTHPGEWLHFVLSIQSISALVVFFSVF